MRSDLITNQLCRGRAQHGKDGFTCCERIDPGVVAIVEMRAVQDHCLESSGFGEEDIRDGRAWSNITRI